MKEGFYHCMFTSCVALLNDWVIFQCSTGNCDGKSLGCLHEKFLPMLGCLCRKCFRDAPQFLFYDFKPNNSNSLGVLSLICHVVGENRALSSAAVFCGD